ncbi:hypothetical protein MSG28_006029 [Choristoneura fumiferana]|uniref:Uncharacterized protein n=1 Tax=Choristoneura fumiferana TaxID=7141 RepID=A0ACC0L1T1_CHOFU|nr:hypothetical protein MSG28_006029 [Choristoneura fumiferana]
MPVGHQQYGATTWLRSKAQDRSEWRALGEAYLVSINIVCGCFCLCLYFAKKQGWFPTVNRNGPAHGRVNRSGPAHGRVNRSGPSFGANRSSFGSGVSHDTPVYDDNNMINEEPLSVFIHNNLLRTQDDPTIGSDVVNTHGWNTAHTIVDKLPPSHSEATGLPSEPRHQSQNRHYDFDCRPHGNEHKSEKCSSGYGYEDSGTCDSYDRAGTTYDSGGNGGGGDSGGGDTGGGDTGGCDSGGGGDTTTD